MDVLILRDQFHPRATPGICRIYSRGQLLFRSVSLELPWQDNRRGVSRIPAGKYFAVYEKSPRFRRKLWELKDVPGRSEVKVHVGNFVRQIEGCILLGQKIKDIDGDQIPDITSSAITMRAFHAALRPAEGTPVLFHFVDYDSLIRV